MYYNDEEKITHFDRSTLVRDYDYGSISAYNLNYLDVPTFAKIEFDKVGNIIFEDYTKLDEYLEEEFIPKYIKKKNKLDKEIDEKFEYFSIQLSDILKLRLSELEMMHVFEYLESKDIKIGGYSPDIDSENYDYIRTYKNFELPEHDNKVDEKQRIREYQATKNKDLFEEIIKNNMRLALAIAYTYAIKTGHDIEEIRSFAHEGLIYAVNHFNPDRAGKFSSYAWPCIRGFILRGLPELDFIFHRKDLYQKYIIYKEMVEEYTGDDVLENPKLLNDVFNLMYETGEISSSEISILSGLIRTNIPKLDEFLFDAEDDYNLEIDVILNTTKDELIECLNCYLTEKEKKIIILRFGLYGGEPKSLEEVGKIFNLTRERIRQIERKALRKLRYPCRNKKFKGTLDLYCQKGEKTI